MGLDVSTYVVFGKVVDTSVLKPIKRVRGCKHNTDLSAKFCSECGKPVWVEKKTILLDSMEKDGLSYFFTQHEANQAVLGFLMSNTGSHRNYNTTSDYLEMAGPEDGMVEEIIEFCRKHDIACDENELKTYAFSFFSY